jgi:hypothetical protein
MAALTDAEYLQELKKAYQKLVLGKQATSIQKDGRKVEYKPSDRATLKNEIENLEARLNQGSSRRRPARLF